MAALMGVPGGAWISRPARAAVCICGEKRTYSRAARAAGVLVDREPAAGEGCMCKVSGARHRSVAGDGVDLV